MESHTVLHLDFVHNQHHVTWHHTLRALISTTTLTYFNFSSTKNENEHRKTFKYTTHPKVHTSWSLWGRWSRNRMNRGRNSASERECPACLLPMIRLAGRGVCCFLPSPLLLLLLPCKLSSAAGSGGYVGMRAAGGSSRAGWVWARWLWSESLPARLWRASPGTRAPWRFQGTSRCFLALVATPGSMKKK